MRHEYEHSFESCGLGFRVSFSAELSELTEKLIRPFSTKRRAKYKYSAKIVLVPLVEERDCHKGSLERGLKIEIVKNGERNFKYFIEDPTYVSISTAIGHIVSYAATENSGLVLHAAALKKNRRCSLFVGPSGAGKSTIAHSAKGVEILHDDRVGIRCFNGKWMGFSIPQVESTGTVAKNGSAVLNKIFLIEKGNKLSTSTASSKKDIHRLFRQTVCPVEDENIQLACSRGVLDLFGAGLIQKLTFRKDSDVSRLI